MQLRTRAAAAAALASFSMLATPATAAPYAAANLALTSTKYDDVKNGTGFSLVGGYEIDEFGMFPVFVEGSHYDSGKLKVDDTADLQGIRLSYQGYQVFGGVALKLAKDSGSRVWGKVGYYSLDGKVSDGSDSAEEKLTGLSFGLGADWMFSRQLGARFEIEQPTKVKSIPGFNVDETTALSIVKIGLVWRPSFGGGGGTAAASYNPSPYQTPSVAAAPVTAVVTPFAVGGTAKLAAGTPLRGQPKPDGTALGNVPTESTVTLKGTNSGSYGEWWFVSGAGLQGWVLASALMPP